MTEQSLETILELLESPQTRIWNNEVAVPIDLKANHDQTFYRAIITNYRKFQSEGKCFEIMSSEYGRLVKGVPPGTLVNLTITVLKCESCGVTIEAGHGKRTCSQRCQKHRQRKRRIVREHEILRKVIEEVDIPSICLDIPSICPSIEGQLKKTPRLDNEKPRLDKTHVKGEVLRSGRYTIEILALPAPKGRKTFRNIEVGSRNETFFRIINRLKADGWTEGKAFSYLERMRADTEATKPSWRRDPYTSEELAEQVHRLFANPDYGISMHGQAPKDSPLEDENDDEALNGVLSVRDKCAADGAEINAILRAAWNGEKFDGEVVDGAIVALGLNTGVKMIDTMENGGHKARKISCELCPSDAVIAGYRIVGENEYKRVFLCHTCVIEAAGSLSDYRPINVSIMRDWGKSNDRFAEIGATALFVGREEV